MRWSSHRSLGVLGILVAGPLVFLGWPRTVKSDGACSAPEIRVFKRQNELEILCDGALRQTISVTFGGNPVGPKEREGDQRTPEGTYRVVSRVRSERFHRFIGISYPNDDDRRRAAEKGVTRLGGGIGIHGTSAALAPAARLWIQLAKASGFSGAWGPTDGCIGVTNEDAEAVFDTVTIGTKVVIAPARPARP